MFDVDAGDSVLFNIPVLSNPEPEVKVYFNDQPLPSEMKVKVDIMSESIRVCRRDVTKADIGHFKVKIFNEHGEESEEFVVKVNDVPEAPTNIKIAEVGHNFCTVTWTEPTNDGGAPLNGFVVEKKEVHRRVFSQVGKVTAAKREYFVDDLDEETAYLFRVAAMNKFGVGKFSDEVEMKTGVPFTAPTMDNAPKVVKVEGKSCSLEWSEPTEDGGSPIYGYDVYVRSNGQEWEKLNKEPIFR